MRKADLDNPCLDCIKKASDLEKQYKEMTIAKCKAIDEMCAIENMEHLLMANAEIPERFVKAEMTTRGDIVIKYEMGLPKVPIRTKGDAYYRALQKTWISETQRALFLLAQRIDTSQIQQREPGEKWMVVIKELVPKSYKGPLDVDNYMIKFIIDGIRYSGILGNVDDSFLNLGYGITGDFGDDFGAEVTIKKVKENISLDI